MTRTTQLIAVWLAGATALYAGTTIHGTNRYAYAANAGWVDAYADGTNGAVIGRYVCANYLYAANTGWIHLGDGTPANGVAYGNASASDYGVNVSPYGLLQGYAWGANTGWIAFEQTYGKPAVDLTTGVLSGYAWSANTGWISLSNAYAHVQTERLAGDPDTDGDGLPDPWEYSYTNTLAGLGASPADADGDGSPDADEYGAGTDPTNPSNRLAITALVATNTAALVVSWDSTDTRFYRVSVSQCLTNGWGDSSLGLITDAAASNTTRTVSLTPTNGMFLRVQAELPLGP